MLSSKIIVYLKDTPRNSSIKSGTFEATLRRQGFVIVSKTVFLNETGIMSYEFEAGKRYSMCFSQTDIDSWSDVDFAMG